jgi:DNA-binding PadR family transcriptional regulator
VLHILLALSTGERHGYGIMKQVQTDSQGKAKMGPGTLYGSMGRMMEAGLIRESDKRVDPEMDDERRIYYELTGAGRAALEAVSRGGGGRTFCVWPVTSRAGATEHCMRCCCGCIRGLSTIGTARGWRRRFTTCAGSA